MHCGKLPIIIINCLYIHGGLVFIRNITSIRTGMKKHKQNNSIQRMVHLLFGIGTYDASNIINN